MWVKREFAKTLIMCCVTMYAPASYGTVFYEDAYMVGGHLNINQNVVFDQNSVIDGTFLNVTNSVVVTNHGDINAHMNLCAECNMFIHNSGVFDVDYDASFGGHVFQIIASPDEIVPIDINTAFDIIAGGNHMLSMSDLLNTAMFADRLILNNAMLVLDACNMPMARMRDVPIMLVGDISVTLPTIDILTSGPILKNIDGNGTVTIFAPDVDELHAIQSYVVDGNVYGRIIRETDYYKIFKNDAGAFLNTLRDIMPDDKLLGAMDGAQTMDDLNVIMRHSVRLHPINLINPLHVMRKYGALDLQNSVTTNFNKSSFAITSDKLNAYGINAGFSIAETNRISTGLTAHVSTGAVDDDINEYDMIAYGGRMNVKYDDKRFVINGNVGATFAMFDVGPVMVDGDVAYDPYGLMFYGDISVGYRINTIAPITFMPFVGVSGDVSSVANVREFNGAANTGAEINIQDAYFGMHYDYGIRVMVDTDGAFGAAIRAGIDLPADSINMDMSAGVMHDEYATSFKLSTAIRWIF